MEIKIDFVPKPRMTRSDKWKRRKVVLDYFKFKDEILLKTKGLNFGDTLSLGFVVKMPTSWSKKKKTLMLGAPHKQRPDLDNLIKAFKDAVFKEDSHVWKYGEMYKIWGQENKIIIGS